MMMVCFAKKSDLLYEIFAMKKNQSRRVFNYLKSLLESYHKHNGGKAHLPMIEFIPQR